MSQWDIHRSPTSEKLLMVLLVPSRDWTLNATNYWTIELRIVRSGQDDGEIVATYSLADRNLTAGEPVTLYDDPVGLPAAESDVLRVVLTATLSPTALGPFTVQAQMQRMTGV